MDIAVLAWSVSFRTRISCRTKYQDMIEEKPLPVGLYHSQFATDQIDFAHLEVFSSFDLCNMFKIQNYKKMDSCDAIPSELI